MTYLKYTAMVFIVVSLAAFAWLAWFLLSTPSSAFDTQGPGLLGAFVMFGAQIAGIVGISLFAIWLVLRWWQNAQDTEPL